MGNDVIALGMLGMSWDLYVLMGGAKVHFSVRGDSFPVPLYRRSQKPTTPRTPIMQLAWCCT